MDISDNDADGDVDEASYAYPEAARKNSDIDMNVQHECAEPKSETDVVTQDPTAGTSHFQPVVDVGADALAEQAERRR